MLNYAINTGFPFNVFIYFYCSNLFLVLIRLRACDFKMFTIIMRCECVMRLRSKVAINQNIKLTHIGIYQYQHYFFDHIIFTIYMLNYV